MPPDGLPGEKDPPPLPTEKDPPGPGVNGSGAENVANQPAPTDPMAHILELLQEQKAAMSGLRSELTTSKTAAMAELKSGLD